MREKQPQQVDKEARIAPVPKTQKCDICGGIPAPEHHFVTIPLPVGFTRICDDDYSRFKKMIRERVRDDVRIVLQHVKDNAAYGARETH